MISISFSCVFVSFKQNVDLFLHIEMYPNKYLFNAHETHNSIEIIFFPASSTSFLFFLFLNFCVLCYVPIFQLKI